ncbi:MAG TPA: NAD-dependent epimerase/dehydratase family protein [Spirochaetia bacterium]|nr:NAD-dependent epimerase/dehydratase family protein [Spirochaetia bacterium]
MKRKTNYLSNKRVLVTGGAGFIGSHLVDDLISRNNDVVIIDDLSSGNKKNINKKCKFIKLSTTKYKPLLKIFSNFKPEYVFHLAANTNVPLSIKDPIFDFQTLVGSLNLLEACRKYSPKLFIYISSGFIYGNTDNRPISEDEVYKPISPYSISKNTIENYLEFYHNVYGIEYVGLRPATIYGPRQDKGALADYITKLISNKQAEIYGDGTKTRDYLYISDAISGINHIIDLPKTKRNKVFNIGTSLETSLLDVYRMIANLLGKKAKPIFCDERPGELLYYSIDHSLITKETGWTPKISLLDGIKELLKYRKISIVK